MIKADLHIHSRVSDGSFTIEQLAAAALSRGLKAIAITDHDTLSHVDKIPENAGLKIVPGIEISACDYEKGRRVHILGYNIKETEAVEKFVHPLLLARHENSMKQIGILKKNGFSIDYDKLYKADGRYIYKQHIMEYLVNTGQAPDMFGDFYRQIFKNGGICDFDITYLDPYEAVRTIKQAGGLAVLAHSGQQQNFSLIPKLVSEGLDGLEINHPSNSTEDKKIIKQYAEDYGLFLTGGSDFHGIYEKGPNELGGNLSEESGVDAICCN